VTEVMGDKIGEGEGEGGPKEPERKVGQSNPDDACPSFGHQLLQLPEGRRFFGCYHVLSRVIVNECLGHYD
jgi:hypothetical protein